MWVLWIEHKTMPFILEMLLLCGKKMIKENVFKDELQASVCKPFWEAVAKFVKNASLLKNSNWLEFLKMGQGLFTCLLIFTYILKQPCL